MEVIKVLVLATLVYCMYMTPLYIKATFSERYFICENYASQWTLIILMNTIKSIIKREFTQNIHVNHYNMCVLVCTV